MNTRLPIFTLLSQIMIKERVVLLLAVIKHVSLLPKGKASGKSKTLMYRYYYSFQMTALNCVMINLSRENRDSE